MSGVAGSSEDRFRGHVAGAYFIERPYEGGDRVSQLLPPRVISASPCIADVGPSIEWTAESSGPRTEAWLREEFACFGIRYEHFLAVMRWLATAYDEGDLLWPDVLTSPEAARSFAQRFTLPTDSLVLLGLALPEPCVDDFLESEPGYAGIPRLLRKHEPLAGDAEVLGYEVLAFEHDEFHSWMCTELGEHAVAELNVHPDRAGFLRTLEDAEHVSQWATSDAAGDGKTWLPWLLVRYGWA